MEQCGNSENIKSYEATCTQNKFHSQKKAIAFQQAKMRMSS